MCGELVLGKLLLKLELVKLPGLISVTALNRSIYTKITPIKLAIVIIHITRLKTEILHKNNTLICKTAKRKNVTWFTV